MNSFLQWPHPAQSLETMADDASRTGSAAASAPSGTDLKRRKVRQKIEYRMIYGVCLFVFLWAGLIECLNPMAWNTAIMP